MKLLLSKDVLNYIINHNIKMNKSKYIVKKKYLYIDDDSEIENIYTKKIFIKNIARAKNIYAKKILS